MCIGVGDRRHGGGAIRGIRGGHRVQGHDTTYTQFSHSMVFSSFHIYLFVSDCKYDEISITFNCRSKYPC